MIDRFLDAVLNVANLMPRITGFLLIICLTNLVFANEEVRLNSQQSVVGLVYPFFQVPVPSRSSGVIIDILKDVGDRVAKDEVLAQLENVKETIQLDLAKLKIQSSEVALKKSEVNFAFLSKKLNKDRDLLKKGAITEDSLEERQNRFDLAEQDLQNQRINLENAIQNLKLSEKALEDTLIRSPLDGVIQARMIEPGQQLGAGSSAFKVLMTQMLYIELHLSENYYQAIAPGQKLSFKFVHTDQSGHALIYLKDPAIDPTSRTFRVRLKIENLKGKFLSGRQVRVQLPPL